MLYQTGEVAKAAKIEPFVVNQWVTRGHVVMSDKDRDSHATGRNRLFSFDTVIEIAVAAELVRIGMKAPDALKAARSFAHAGTGIAPKRDPGRPFDKGDTFLIVGPAATVVVNVTDGESLRAGIHVAGANGAVVVDAGAIYREVVGALGGDPERPRETTRM